MTSGRNIFTSLDDSKDYIEWREQKLESCPETVEELVVQVKDPASLDDDEYAAIADLLVRANMAIWMAKPEPERDKIIALNMGRQYGMRNLDHNMGADHDGVSELSVREGQWRAGYIPYTNRPIHWHTDGYYNTVDRKIKGMVLYCVQAAARGGENALVDHEIAYIHLRDENPGYVQALFHPEAMTIPANIINGQELRPDRTGPVFSVLEDGSLHMRYTARARNVIWRDDPLTREAIACLSEFLASDSPFIFRATLAPGQGLICNNVLHDRSGFDNDETHRRMLYRLRFYDRAITVADCV